MPPHQPAPGPQSWRPSLRRSVRLFADFRHEQDDPRRFYTALAADSVGQLEHYAGGSGRGLDGARVLDVGGGPGFFRDAFTAAGATYFALDADVGELSGQGGIASGSVIGDGMRLPFRDGAVDVCYSSNVLEHVPDRVRMVEEMLRVTRPGGIVFVSFTLWWGPWGGHETSPWHYLGGGYARRRYRRRHGHEPKNRFGESMYAATATEMLRWAARQQRAEVLAAVPRYHPWWAAWLMRVPVLREVLSWNLLLVLRKH
ncbi:class I SAM-dependent methyltransferase [Nocardioides insulae]|uniref:class I SAM-dependent methyltransferase n=1 Tax=Nocardioides insulae TaxID=394734 RepID=UPI000406C003|nr:class I SAM-dependent methyltransferase [Nocardioides insulae]